MTLEKIRLRRLTSPDLLTLNRLIRVLWQLSPPKTDKDRNWAYIREAYRAMFEDPNLHLVVAEIEGTGKIVGTGTLLVQPNITHGGRPYAHAENIVIDKEYRDIGIGTLIMEQLILLAGLFDCYKIVLSCAENKVGFYDRLGFKHREISLRMDP